MKQQRKCEKAFIDCEEVGRVKRKERVSNGDRRSKTSLRGREGERLTKRFPGEEEEGVYYS